MIAKSDILIVIPTYNEAGNILSLLTSIDSLQAHYELLIVDDSSSDNTLSLVDTFANECVHKFVRPDKQGLCSAYLDAFKWALARHYRVVVQMDADHSHNPIHLERMIEALSSCDFVVGSRYTKEGKNLDSPLYRRTLSRLGSLYARTVLLSPIKDLTSGYNVWTRELIDFLLSQKLLSRGYCFQIELKHRAKMHNFKHREVPISFDKRFAGASKISKSIVLEALWKVWHIRFCGG